MYDIVLARFGLLLAPLLFGCVRIPGLIGRRSCVGAAAACCCCRDVDDDVPGGGLAEEACLFPLRNDL